MRRPGQLPGLENELKARDDLQDPLALLPEPFEKIGPDPERVPAAVAGRGEEKVLAVQRDIRAVLGTRRVDLFAHVDRRAPLPIPSPEGNIEIVPSGSSRLHRAEDEVAF